MMNHARELMDSENEILSSIGYVLWSRDGEMSPEHLNELAQNLLNLDTQWIDEETLRDSYRAGYNDGYSDGKEAGKVEKTEEHTTDLIAALTAVRKNR